VKIRAVEEILHSVTQINF